MKNTLFSPKSQTSSQKAVVEGRRRSKGQWLFCLWRNLLFWSNLFIIGHWKKKNHNKWEKRQVIFNLKWFAPSSFHSIFGVNEQNQLLICVLSMYSCLYSGSDYVHSKEITLYNEWLLLWFMDEVKPCVCKGWKEIVEEFNRTEIEGDLTIEWSLLFTWIGLLLSSNNEAKEWIIWEYNHSHMRCYLRYVSFYHIELNKRS